MVEANSDRDLVQAVQGGNRLAGEELVRRWTPRILALCHARTGSGQAAEDLAQEALLRGFRALSTLKDPAKFGSWLCGIALRACLDWRKARRRAEVHLEAHGAMERSRAGGVSGTDEAERARALVREVEALPEEYREALMLYYYDDLTYRQLAQLLGVSAATVNLRLTRARALLRERLMEYRR